ncbi:nitric oxide synthase-interacting protein isoform X2 [Equus quagga]|uniref:nitric oxide synthase-interacting protein isoform X2 n=1 Tax=Equus quagga TaxID=89248 RepID=UPI001EE1B3A1|nr:nitric oxide synthase-interacting protein isoform X2 [Equus quagga]
MRRMTRHGKNCTAGAVYTYHEKKKDTAASGYGTQNIRLSRDAVKDFDCCCLSLQPCHDPVVTPDGYLYEREAILEYILHQKKEIARQMKAYEKQRGARREEQKELQRAAAQDQVRGFLEKEASIVSRPLNPFTPKAATGNGPDDAQPGPSAGPAGKDKDKALPSFWIPSLTPEAKATKLEKPRALRVRRDPRQPEQRHPVRRAAALWGRGHPRVCGEAHSEGHGGPSERGEAHGPRHHRAAAGRHRLRRLWSEAAGREVEARDAGLSADTK